VVKWEIPVRVLGRKNLPEFEEHGRVKAVEIETYNPLYISGRILMIKK